MVRPLGAGEFSLKLESQANQSHYTIALFLLLLANYYALLKFR